MSLHLFLILVFFVQLTASAQTSNVVIFREGGDTIARAINNNGQIAGYYTPTGTAFPRGFIRAADGTMQTVLITGAAETRLHGINDQGETVGTRDNNTRAFIRSASGVFTEITVPEALSVTAAAINNNGFVLGGYQKSTTGRRAYLRNLVGAIVPLADIFTGDVDAAAISNSGDRVVLIQSTTSPSFGTIYMSNAQGNFVTFNPNVPGSNSFYYTARGLTATNVLVGEQNGQGFLVRQPGDGVIFTIPNTTATMPYGINDKNQIVGAVRDNQNQLSGFLMDPCAPALQVPSRTHGSGAESGTFDIQANGFCVWIAETDVPWITLAKSIGSGSGTIRYNLAANTLFERTGRIKFGTREFVITQASADCRYTVTSSLTGLLPTTGGSVTFNVATSPSCPWTVLSPDSSWVHISAIAGTGNTTLTAQIDPISQDAIFSRTSTLNIAGTTISVTQAALPCDVTLSRSALNVPADGALETVRVTVRSACTWFPNAGASWISIIGNTSFQGSSTLTLRIARNLGSAARTATVNIGTPSSGSPQPTIAITQQGASGCSYVWQSESGTVAGEGGSTSVSVLTGPGCPLNPTSTVPWLEITSTLPPTSFSSTAIVNYRAQPNPSRLARRGGIQLGGSVFYVDQLGNQQLGLGFVPITACRVMDTRAGQGFSSDQGPPALTPNQSRQLSIAGRCGVPSAARAFALNITAYPIGGLSFLTVWPANQARPTASTLNSFNGRVVSNVAIIPAALFASPVAFYASDATNLAVDVIGYFMDPAPESLVLYPVAPCRIVDTRTTNTPLGAGASRDVPVAGRCGVPANAAAVSLNATAVPRGTLESLTVWTAGRTRPLASTLNAPGGQVTANATLVATGTAGAVSVFATHETDFLIDVNGYFGPPSDAGLYFNAVTPCRIADTRTGYGGAILAPSVVRTFVPGTTACAIPSNAKAHLVNATVVPPGPLAFLSLFPSPNWTGSSTLNAFDGQVTANLAIVPDDGLGIGAFASSPTHLVLDVSGYFATLPVDQRRPTIIP